MKYLKYLILTIIAAISIALLAPYFINLNNHKEKIVTLVKEATGRDLVISGDINLSILPRPKVTIHKVKLSSLKEAQHPFVLETNLLKASLSIIDLLKGRISLANVTLLQPKFNLEKLPNGTGTWEIIKPVAKEEAHSNSNIMSETVAAPYPASAVSAESISSKLSEFLVVHHVIIEDGIIEYRKKDDVTKLTNLNMNLEVEGIKGPLNLELDFVYLTNKYAIATNIAQIAAIMPISATVKVGSEKITLSGQADLSTMRFDGKINGAGNLGKMSAAKIFTSLQKDYKTSADISANQEAINFDNLNFATGDIDIKASGNYNIKTAQLNVNLNLNPGDIIMTISEADAPKGVSANNLQINAKSLKPFIDALHISGIKNLPLFTERQFTFNGKAQYSPNHLMFEDLKLGFGNIDVKGLFGVKDLDKSQSKIFYNLTTDNGSELSNLFGFKLPFFLGNIRIGGESNITDGFIQTSSTISTAGSVVNFSGKAHLPDVKNLDFIIDASGKDLVKTIQILSKNTINIPIKDFYFTGKLTKQSDKFLDFNMTDSYFTIGTERTKIICTNKVTFDAPKPRIISDLRISSININQLSKQSAADINSVSSSSIASVNIDNGAGSKVNYWPRTKIDLSALRFIDGDFNISLQKFIYDSLNFDTLKAKLKLSDGQLQLSSLTGNLYGGSLEMSGQISGKNQEQPFALKLSIKNAQLKNISPVSPSSKHNQMKIIAGQLNFDTNLTSKGDSQDAYVKNLGGNVNLDVKNGRISGINLGQIINSLKKITNLENLVSDFQNAFKGGETSFTSLTTNIAITNGIGKLSNSSLKADQINGEATGQINFYDYVMNISATISTILKDVPPFTAKLYGRLDQPEYKLDLGALKQHLLKNVLQNNIDKVKTGDERVDKLLQKVLGGGKKQNTQSEGAGADASPKSEQTTQNQGTNNSENSSQDAGAQGEDKLKEQMNKALEKGLKNLFKQ